LLGTPPDDDEERVGSPERKTKRVTKLSDLLGTKKNNGNRTKRIGSMTINLDDLEEVSGIRVSDDENEDSDLEDKVRQRSLLEIAQEFRAIGKEAKSYKAKKAFKAPKM
jgi:hypothetical protein